MFTFKLDQNFLQSGIHSKAKHKLLLLFNVSGLSVGIATIILFLAYAIHELSYDKEHPNPDRIYRVVERADNSDRRFSMVILSLISGILACVIAYFCLDEFNLLLNRALELNFAGFTSISILVFCVLLGILSGICTVIKLSAYKSKLGLSGNLSIGVPAIALNKFVFVFLSAISIGFIIASFTLFQQKAFLKKLPTHYERTNRLQVVSLTPEKLFFHETFVFGEHYELEPSELEQTVRASSSSLANKLQNIDGVLSSTPTDFDLTRELSAGVPPFTLQGKGTLPHGFGYGGVGYNAAEVLGLELIAGRDFNEESDHYSSQNNSLSIFIPESIVSLASFSNAEDAIGKTTQFNAGPFENVTGIIVGVFKDIKLGSIKDGSPPMIFGCGLSWAQSANLVIKIDKDNMQAGEEITTLLKDNLTLKSPVIESVQRNYDLIYQQDFNLVCLVFTLTCYKCWQYLT